MRRSEHSRSVRLEQRAAGTVPFSVTAIILYQDAQDRPVADLTVLPGFVVSWESNQRQVEGYYDPAMMLLTAGIQVAPNLWNRLPWESSTQIRGRRLVCSMLFWLLRAGCGIQKIPRPWARNLHDIFRTRSSMANIYRRIAAKAVLGAATLLDRDRPIGD
jgi:hypothetical protein